MASRSFLWRNSFSTSRAVLSRVSECIATTEQFRSITPLQSLALRPYCFQVADSVIGIGADLVFGNLLRRRVIEERPNFWKASLEEPPIHCGFHVSALPDVR